MNTLYNFPLTLPGTLPKDVAAGVEETNSRITEVTNKYLSAKNEITKSQDLTSGGKAKKLSALGEQALKDFGEIEDLIKNYDISIQQRLNAMAIKKTEETVLSFLREKELRDILYEHDPLELEVIYRRAAEKNDTAILNAFENAPSLKPLVSPKLVEELKTDRLKAIYPKQMQEVEDFKAAKAISLGAINTAKNELHKSGITFPVDDPIAELASGGN